MLKFKDLLKQYRLQGSLKVLEISKYIKKTETYIRRLESGDIKPPTYEICNLLIKKLDLSKKEEVVFMRQAFLERIDHEIDFYHRVHQKHIHQDVSTLSHKLDFSLKDNIYQRCLYSISWKTNKEQEILKGKVERFLYKTLYKVIKSFDCKIYYIEISPHEICMAIEIPIDIQIPKFINSLRNYLGNAIRDHFVAFKNRATLWDPPLKITTVGEALHLTQLSKSTHGVEKVK